jgi:hypothetical protein
VKHNGRMENYTYRDGGNAFCTKHCVPCKDHPTWRDHKLLIVGPRASELGSYFPGGSLGNTFLLTIDLSREVTQCIAIEHEGLRLIVKMSLLSECTHT